MAKYQRAWTEDELAALRRLRAAGHTYREIGIELGRTLHMVKGRMMVEQGSQRRRRKTERDERRNAEIRAVTPRAFLDKPGERAVPSQETIAERDARIAAPFRGFTGAFFGDPRVGYSALDGRR
jgi:hypothetical protein